MPLFIFILCIFVFFPRGCDFDLRDSDGWEPKLGRKVYMYTEVVPDDLDSVKLDGDIALVWELCPPDDCISRYVYAEEQGKWILVSRERGYK